jgi:hypothetical protein
VFAIVSAAADPSTDHDVYRRNMFSGKCTSQARLDGKIAIVTGSNTGIGKITAKEFYRIGNDDVKTFTEYL